MVLAADYPFMNILWTMIIFFAWVIWIWMMIVILTDVFRRPVRRDRQGQEAARRRHDHAGRVRHAEAKGARARMSSGGEPSRYQMRQKLISIGDDYWIDDEAGRHAFRVDGKALHLRKTFV